MRFLPPKFRLLLVLLTLGLAACQETAHRHDEGEPTTTYTCPMHPQVVETAPGSCPICGMDLVAVDKGGAEEAALMLSSRQITLGNIRSVPVDSGTVSGQTLLTGRLVTDETQTDVVSSRAAGRIERLWLKETGTRVRQGQPLYELYSEELLTLQREFLLARRQVEELGDEEPRFASFLEAARQKLLLYGLTEAQLTHLAQQDQPAARVTFVAPTSGFVTQVTAQEGQYVAEGGMLYQLARLDPLWVEAELYAQEVAQVQLNTPVQVRVEGQPATPFETRISFRNPEFRVGAQVLLIRAEVPNPEGTLQPGMQATVRLPRSNTQIGMTVPTEAVIRTSKGAHVWIQTSDHTFEERPVMLGEETAQRVAIHHGLQPDARVVVSGAYLLYSEWVLKKGGEPVMSHDHESMAGM
ncbi:efflux RND transporter periplasmic adaptor subunit [Catalinimonas alkaloidigena]|nr:efflux RND transporter periplasmic adaptor subunit [Catalinimonas alkaloidigena]